MNQSSFSSSFRVHTSAFITYPDPPGFVLECRARFEQGARVAAS
jgi:hypothetical protein